MDTHISRINKNVATHILTDPEQGSKRWVATIFQEVMDRLASDSRLPVS